MGPKGRIVILEYILSNYNFFLFKDHLVRTAIIYFESSSGGFLFRFTQFMIRRRRVGTQCVLVKLLPI